MKTIAVYEPRTGRFILSAHNVPDGDAELTRDRLSSRWRSPALIIDQESEHSNSALNCSHCIQAYLNTRLT